MNWNTVAAVGAYHGLNPAMGWLFAVAIAFQHGRAAALPRALAAIALGHVISVALALTLMAVATLVVPIRVLQLGGAAALLAFAAYLFLRRRTHPGRPGMRMRFIELVCWSFLMASAHGAGLMLFPVLVRGTTQTPPSSHVHSAHLLYTHGMNMIAVHSLAMFVAMACAALVAFYLGVGFLRRTWINLDAVWIAALVLAGMVTLARI